MGGWGQDMPLGESNFFGAFVRCSLSILPSLGAKLNKDCHATMASNDGNKLLISCPLRPTIFDRTTVEKCKVKIKKKKLFSEPQLD